MIKITAVITTALLIVATMSIALGYYLGRQDTFEKFALRECWVSETANNDINCTVYIP